MAKQRFSIPRRLLGAGFLALICGLASAQTYRWVDPATGRTMITDTPPPGSAKQVSRTTSAPPAADAQLPFATRQAAQNFPVTLYTGADCAPCQQARELLTKRGVPFTEKTMQSEADLAELMALTGGTGVPVLKVGRQTLKGFEAGNFNSALDLAGYPKSGATTGAAQ